jgi:hypothetical protein
METEVVINSSIFIVEDFETESSILLGQVAGMGSCTYQGSGSQNQDDLAK